MTSGIARNAVFKSLAGRLAIPDDLKPSIRFICSATLWEDRAGIWLHSTTDSTKGGSWILDYWEVHGFWIIGWSVVSKAFHRSTNIAAVALPSFFACKISITKFVYQSVSNCHSGS